MIRICSNGAKLYRGGDITESDNKMTTQADVQQTAAPAQVQMVMIEDPNAGSAKQALRQRLIQELNDAEQAMLALIDSALAEGAALLLGGNSKCHA
jgi:hypothetical protein